MSYDVLQGLCWIGELFMAVVILRYVLDIIETRREIREIRRTKK
jgi:hypothetical protein